MHDVSLKPRDKSKCASLGLSNSKKLNFKGGIVSKYQQGNNYEVF